MGRVEWLKWMMTYRRPKTRVRQIGRFFIFEFYYQLCKLRGYKVEHILKIKPLPAGEYILVWPPLPVSIRLLDEIFPFGRDAHAEYVPYTAEVAEELRKKGRRLELIEISCKFGVVNE